MKDETKPYVPSEEAKTILDGYRLLDDDFINNPRVKPRGMRDKASHALVD